MRSLVFLFLLLLPQSLMASQQLYPIDNFERGLNPGWEEKSFHGRTEYQVVADETGRCLSAESRAAASGLVFSLDLSPAQFPVLNWRWRIERTIPGGDARAKATDDYAARIYVIFPHWFFPLSKTINYIWANQLPQGETIPSSYTSNSIMLAAQSGQERTGEWVVERHDVRADYRRLFGEEPPAIGAVAIMTDTDDTGGVARAWYDDIVFTTE